jgi:signal transduction histidine kinase
VSTTRSSGNGIVIEVSDKGKVLDPEITREIEAGRSSFGFFSIQQHLSHIPGRMEIDTAPGKGTRVVLFVTMRHDPPLSPESVSPRPSPPPNSVR